MTDPTRPTTTAVPMPDGRTLELTSAGRLDGDVLVFHHGTPGSGEPDRLLLEAAAARGLGLVGWSRPGYAGSSRQPGRRVADAARDLESVLDQLGLDRVFVAGWSGGGPHALACATLAPDRVRASLVIAGVAPYAADGLDWMDGMGEDNIAEFTATLAGEPALRPFLDAQRPAMLTLTGPEIAAALESLVSPADVAALTSESGREFAEDMARSTRDALAPGVDGWLDDDLAFVADWGFDPATVAGPVHVWQGAEDLMVPFAHGEWLARHVPCAAHLLPGEGHLSLGVAWMGRMLEELLAEPGA